jgi:hypothetical protein
MSLICQAIPRPRGPMRGHRLSREAQSAGSSLCWVSGRSRGRWRLCGCHNRRAEGEDMRTLRPPPRPGRIALYGALIAVFITAVQLSFFPESFPTLSDVSRLRVAQVIGLYLGWCIPLSLFGYLAARTIVKSLAIYERHKQDARNSHNRDR